MIKSLVLNLQPLLNPNSLFEILIESQETKKKVWPHRMAFDVSPYFNFNNSGAKPSFKNNDSIFCRSNFAERHGSGSDNDVSKTKIIYQKKPQETRAFLTSNIHRILISEENVHGIWTLECEIIRDSEYDATSIDIDNYNNNPAESFPECTGYVGNSKFISEVLKNIDSVFNELQTVQSHAISAINTQDELIELIEYKKYNVNYDWIKIIFYGASIDYNFTREYSLDELYQTRKILNDELENGQYFLKVNNEYQQAIVNEDGEYEPDEVNENDDPKYAIFTFDKDTKTFSYKNQKYVYIEDEGVYRDDNTNEEIKLEDQNIFIYEYDNSALDQNNNTIIQLNPNTKKYVDQNLDDAEYVAVERVVEDGKYIQNEDGSYSMINNTYNRNEKIFEITAEKSMVPDTNDLNTDNNFAELFKEIIENQKDYRMCKILINFDSLGIANNQETFKGETEFGEAYFYPSVLGSEENRIEISNSQDEIKPTIIIPSEITNDENSYLRDFIMFSKIFYYFKEEVLDKDDNEDNSNGGDRTIEIQRTDYNSKIKLYEERRTHPLLWSYINTIWDEYIATEKKIKEAEAQGIELDEEEKFENFDYTKFIANSEGGLGEIGDSMRYLFFININYYKLSDTKKDEYEKTLEGIGKEIGQEMLDSDTFEFDKYVDKYPKLLAPTSLRMARSLHGYPADEYYMEGMEVVRAINRLSRYIDDQELGKETIHTIVKLTRML
jgi:hypothetical protein